VDQDIRYAKACKPDDWRIFGVGLRPYSVGHELLLSHIKGAEASLPFVLAAVFICAQTYERAIAGLDWRWRLWALWVTLRCRFNRSLAASRAAMLADYMAEPIKQLPGLWRNSKSSRTCTTPLPLLLKLDLMQHYGYSEREVLNMPLAQAMWERYAWLESEGAIEFVSATDDQVAKQKEALLKELASKRK
jgi:hypothetical protein